MPFAPSPALAFTASSTIWGAWKEKFDKSYSAEEEAVRFENFRKNVLRVDEVNAQDLTYKLGLNEFTDMSNEEFVSQYMGFRMPKENFGGAPKLGQHEWDGSELPTSIDWVELGAVTAVKNQGQCGSCWSFSTTGALEGAYKISTGSLVEISEQQFVDCNTGFLANNGCNGGSMDTAFGYAEGVDLCTEDSYPYKAVQASSCLSSGCSVAVPKGTVTGYKDVAVLSRIIAASETNMMSAIAQQPVSIAIEADKDIFQQYATGILSGDCGSSLDHGVLAVGYGTLATGGDYWKVKNSWGTTWGLSGYVLLSRGQGGWGECGILSSPSYPILGSSVVV
jgi:C1A family cysteine protease